MQPPMRRLDLSYLVDLRLSGGPSARTRSVDITHAVISALAGSSGAETSGAASLSMEPTGPTP
jgi:hypothetical protein